MKVRILALLVCAVVNMLLGMIWYGAFSKPWMQYNNLTSAQLQTMDLPWMPYVVSFLGAIVSVYILSLIFSRMCVEGWRDGLLSGAAAGLLGLVGLLVGNMFAMKSCVLSLIDGGYVFVLFSIYGLILGVWPKNP